MPVKFIELAITNVTNPDKSTPPKLQCKIEDTACKKGVPVIGLNNTLMKAANKYMSLNKVIEREKRMINESIQKSASFCFELAEKHEIHEYDLSSWFASLDFVKDVASGAQRMQPVKIDVKLKPLIYTAADRVTIKQEREKKLKSQALHWKRQQEILLVDTFSKETTTKAYEYVQNASTTRLQDSIPCGSTFLKRFRLCQRRSPSALTVVSC